MLVSVIIPAYNAEQWIADTIESVLQQTYDAIEIIVVDDGSTDSTVQVAEGALRKGRFPSEILCQKNQGVSAARNRGWRCARGEWVQFLDADDLLVPSKIELQISGKGIRDKVDVLYSDWQRLLYKAGSWCPSDEIRTPLIGQNSVADLLSDANFLQLGSQLFNRTILDRIGGFDEAHTLVEDVELCLKIAMVGGVFSRVRSPQPIFWQRDRPGSLSKLNGRQFVDAYLRNAKLVEHFLRSQQTHDSCLIEAIVEVYFLGARYFADHDPQRFEEVVQDIGSLQPEFLPKGPARLRLLSRMTGYPRAERLAIAYRRNKDRIAKIVENFRGVNN